jgi:arabinan endo-1,5-alpha-L-arabinosidase
MRTSFESDELPSEGGPVTPRHHALSRHFYENPVLDQDFPDPALIQTADGYCYAYATQTLRDGQWINIQAARSRDLVHWEYLGDALPKKPVWARTTQDFWAPSVIYDGSTYFM